MGWGGGIGIGGLGLGFGEIWADMMVEYLNIVGDGRYWCCSVVSYSRFIHILKSVTISRRQA